LTGLAKPITEGLQGFTPTSDDLMSAVRHVPPHIRGVFYDQRDFYRQRIAIGALYQGVIYDRIHHLCDRSPHVRSFVRLLGDVPEKQMTGGDIGQNGFYYTDKGELVVRGNGADLAEFDSLVFGTDGMVLFIEIKISGRNLDDLAEKVTYKREIVKFLLSKDSEFLLVSPVDLGSNPVVSGLMKDDRNMTVRTAWPDDLPPNLNSRAGLRSPHAECKSVLPSEVEGVKAFDYAKDHDQVRSEFMEKLDLPNPLGFHHENLFLLRRIVLGALDPEAVSYVLGAYKLSVDGTAIDNDVYQKRLSSTTMTLTLPEARPKLYLRARTKPNYLSFGPESQNTFVFERNIVKARAPAFFRELESAKEMLGLDLTSKILGRYIRPEVLESHRKFRDAPVW
jgi:hypothetical protein